MANKKKGYDLKAADRRRNLLIQVGLTAVVIIFGVALVLYIVTNKQDKGTSNGGQAIRVTAAQDRLIKNDSGQPKAVLSLYEDFLCPACGQLEQQLGPTINQLIESGALAVDYHMVAILDNRPLTNGYSSRAGAAAYCVADQSVNAFRKFHSALFTPGIQPLETDTSFPDNAWLIDQAQKAGAAPTVADCINSGKYLDLVKGMAKAAGITATPGIFLNDEEYRPRTPQDLIDKVKGIVGEIPSVPATTPPPAPATPAPAPAPATPTPAPAP